MGRQDTALQGQKGDNNFMEPIFLFRAKDEKTRDHLNKPLGHKYISHDSLLAILAILAILAFREHVPPRAREFFTYIMSNEYTDITNKEQLSLCLRPVIENFEVQEDFLGFYQLT